jgi:hypothetical protein
MSSSSIMSIAKQTSGSLATDLVGEEEVSKILSQALGSRHVLQMWQWSLGEHGCWDTLREKPAGVQT